MEEIIDKIKPKIISNCEIINGEDFYGNGFYILACEDYEKYLKIDSDKLVYVEEIIKMFTGSNTLIDISNILYEKFNKKVDVYTFYKILLKNNFINLGSKHSKDSIKNELSIMSTQLFKIEFENQFNFLKKSSKKIEKVTRIVYCLLFAISIICIWNAKYVIDIKNITLKNSPSLAFFTFIVINLIVIVPHELSHIIVGTAYGKNLNKITVNLYSGIFIMFIVNFRGLTTLKDREKFHVLIAGIITNLMIFIVCWGILSLQWFSNSARDIISIIAISNLFNALANFSPFFLSDGYFLFSILINKYNMRTYLIKKIFLKNNTNELTKKDKKIYIGYIFISLVFIIYMTICLIFWLMSMIRAREYALVTIFIFVFIYSKCNVIKNFLKLRKSQ
ncbi:MAG: hypothetical protein ACREV6_02440 [Clostridium sp.]|uniref:hypothetical protein n=1 Tax=Clostridium sp. TaxID=1506 RepID=UPI003D6D2E2D